MRNSVLAAKFSLFLCVVFLCCGKINKDKDMSEDIKKYHWVPVVSAPVKYPVEVFDMDFILEKVPEGDLNTEEFSFFGNPTIHQGMAVGSCGISYDENNKTVLPHCVDALWLSYLDRKVYSLYADLPYEQIEYLFSKGYDYYDEKDSLIKKSFESLDLCFLPDGKAVLYMKGNTRTILLDWIAQGKETEEFNDAICEKERTKSIKEFIDWTLDHNSDMVVDKDLPIAFLINKYFERFFYKINVDFENENSSVVWAREDYTNSELLIARNRSRVESIKMPSRIKTYEMTWNCNEYKYHAYFYFNEEEMLRLFDEAYGENHSQEGVLNISVCKYNNLFEISLNVGERKFIFQKTEIRVFKAPKSDEKGNWELVYKNYEKNHQNNFRVK